MGITLPGADPGGGGVLGVGTPPPFGGPQNFIKRKKTSRACARKRCFLVLNSYPDPPPPPFRNPVFAPASPPPPNPPPWIGPGSQSLQLVHELKCSILITTTPQVHILSVTKGLPIVVAQEVVEFVRHGSSDRHTREEINPFQRRAESNMCSVRNARHAERGLPLTGHSATEQLARWQH